VSGDVLCDCCNDTGAVASGSSGRLDTPALGLEAEARSCGRTPAQHSSGRSKSALWRAADRRRGTAGIGAKMVWAQRRFRPGVARGASSAQAMTTAAIEAAPALLGAAAARYALAPSYKFVDQGLGVPGRRSHYLVLASVKRTAVHHHVRASQQPLVPSARRPAAEAETNTERERATTASVNAVAAYVGNTPAVFRVSNFDPRLCRRRPSGRARRGAARRRRGPQGRSPGKYRQIPNSRLSACTPAGSPEKILRVP